MKMRFLPLAVLLTAFSFGQGSNFGVANQYIPSTVAALGTASAGNKNVVRRITDPQSATDCTSGGGAYATTIVLCVSTGSAWVASGGGGGITNAAGANVIPKSDGTNLVASSISDNGTTVSVSEGVALTGNNAAVVGYTQGPDPTALAACTTANTRCEFVGTAVTSFKVHKSDVGAQGIENGTLTGSTITQGFSGDANHSTGPTGVVIGSGTSIGSTSLCSTVFCPVGTYRVNTYIDITTACGTSGTYVVNLIYIDDQGSKTIPININGTGAVASTGVLTTTSTANFGEDTQIIRSTGAASINYSTTAVACGTAGPMVGKLYLSVEAVQ